MLSRTPPENYFKILGVTPDATPNQIKKAYQLLIAKSQQNKHSTLLPANKMEIQTAYAVLSDPVSRNQHYQEIRNSNPEEVTLPQRESSLIVFSSHDQQKQRITSVDKALNLVTGLADGSKATAIFDLVNGMPVDRQLEEVTTSTHQRISKGKPQLIIEIEMDIKNLRILINDMIGALLNNNVELLAKLSTQLNQKIYCVMIELLQPYDAAFSDSLVEDIKSDRKFVTFSREDLLGMHVIRANNIMSDKDILLAKITAKIKTIGEVNDKTSEYKKKVKLLHKIAVLEMTVKYIKGDADIERLRECMLENPTWDKAFGTALFPKLSKTRKLIEKAVKLNHDSLDAKDVKKIEAPGK